MRGLTVASVAAALLTWSPLAEAIVTQPSGLVVPTSSGSGEIQLSDLFLARGEAIDWKANAVTVPETFSPLCEFSAEFLLRQAGGASPLGWYNVAPGSTTPPPASAIYEVVACNTAPGAVVSSATIRSHPSYAGGLVGFALANGSGCVSFSNPGSIGLIHYTESRYNAKHLSGQPWFMALVYDSKVEANAFYVAFEDGSPNAFAFNNDGDYNDFVVLLRGLVCSGGGGPCQTGRPGACAAGIEVCETGALVCKPIVSAGAEACNAVDDDCDGTVDDGDLCPPEHVCDRGQCIARCGSGEFVCPPTEVCNAAGLCVDPACETMSCAAGERCVGGVCSAPCAGVLCPHGEVCRTGACVDPCAGVTCGANQVCESGICRESCACRPCGSSQECEASSGRCVAAGCADAGCSTGSHCETGIGCVDDCSGAACPPGQACQAGDCVGSAGGAGGAGGGSGGVVIVPDAGGSGNGGAGGAEDASAPLGGTGAGGAAGGGVGYATDSGGCGCRVARPARLPHLAWLVLGAVVASSLGLERRATRPRGAPATTRSRLARRETAPASRRPPAE